MKRSKWLVRMLSVLLALTLPVCAAAETTSMRVGYALDPNLTFQGGETVAQNSWTALYEENGVKLDIIYNVEASQRNEKQAQMIMAGDYPDYMNVSSNNFRDWAMQGVFTDLTPYFDQYASELTKAYYQTEYGKKALDSGKLDGKLYALPAASAGYDSLPVPWIRNDWLTKLGLSVPKTVAEFYAVAEAFTKNDPDGNGQDDTYGLAVNGKDVFSANGGVDAFFQMFGAVPGIESGSITFIDHDGQAVYGGSLVDECTAALQMLIDMYQNGYISKDFITAGGEQVNQQLGASKAGMVLGRMYIMGTPWQDAVATVPEAEFIAAPLPGVTAEQAGRSYYTAIPGDFYTLSSKCGEDKVKAFFTMINLGVAYLAQPDTLSQADYEKYNGKAGEYTGWQLCLTPYGNPIKNLEALAKHQYALETGDTSKLNAENLRDFNAMQDYLENKDRRAELTEEEIGAFNSGLFFYSVWGSKQCSYAAIDEMIQMGNIMYSAYDAPMTDKMIECGTTLDTLARETIVGIITGNQPITAYADFVNTWNELGGSEITEEADAWYQSVK